MESGGGAQITARLSVITTKVITHILSLFAPLLASSCSTLMDPPSYDEARLTAGGTNTGSISASFDIAHFLEIAREQIQPAARIKGMFTATEAVFWIATSAVTVEELVPVVGGLAQYSYLYLHTYNVAKSEERDNEELHLRLQQLFDKWQRLILWSPQLYALSVDVPPLRQLTCDRARYYLLTHSVRDLGYTTLDLILDRTYVSELYGGLEARVGFPRAYEYDCPLQEGQRRRHIRRLLNNAEMESPGWSNLSSLVRGWCNECDVLHLR